MLNNFLPAAQTQGMVYGAVLVLALLIAPQGLLGLIGHALDQRRSGVLARAPKTGALEARIPS